MASDSGAVFFLLFLQLMIIRCFSCAHCWSSLMIDAFFPHYTFPLLHFLTSSEPKLYHTSECRLKSQPLNCLLFSSLGR